MNHIEKGIGYMILLDCCKNIKNPENESTCGNKFFIAGILTHGPFKDT